MDEIDIWEPEVAMVKAFNEVLEYIAHQINIQIKRKRLALSEKNPGAVFGNDPRIIFLKMIRRAEYYSIHSRLGRMCAARPKFNEAMNNTAANHEHYIMNAMSCTRKHHFDICGNLSDAGKSVFWRELDHLMERFDRNEIKLMPNTRSSLKY